MLSKQYILWITMNLIHATISAPTYLNSSYDHDVYLSVANNPYYINQSVFFFETSTLYIANGVELVFKGDYTMNIMNNIDAGCFELNTTDINWRGLVNKTHFITISADVVGNGKISIFAGKSGRFCNTKFMNIDIGIEFISPFAEDLYIDNSEFINLNQATSIDISIPYYMSDSIATNISNINEFSSGIYDNCEFSKYTQFFGNGLKTHGNDEISIINSKMNQQNAVKSDFSGWCINIASYTTVIYPGIHNNVLYDGYYGIYIEYSNKSEIYIGNNNITNNDVAGLRTERGNLIIEGNSFSFNARDIYLGHLSEPTDVLNVSIMNNMFTKYHQTSIYCGYAMINNLYIEYNTFTNSQPGSSRFMQFQYNSPESSIIYIEYNQFINDVIEAGILIEDTTDIYIRDNNFINITLNKQFEDVIETRSCTNITIHNNKFTGVSFIEFTALYRSTEDYNVYFDHNDIIDNAINVDPPTIDVYILKIERTSTIYIALNKFINWIDINNYDVVALVAWFIRMDKISGYIDIMYNDFMEPMNTTINSYIGIADIKPGRRRLLANSSNISVYINYNNFYFVNDQQSVIKLENDGNPYDVDANLNYFNGIDNIGYIRVYDACFINTYGKIKIESVFISPINFSTPDLYPPCVFMSTTCWTLQQCTYQQLTTPPELLTNTPTNLPSILPTNAPSVSQTDVPTNAPTNVPTNLPSNSPTDIPTDFSSTLSTRMDTQQPSAIPTAFPSAETINPSSDPTKHDVVIIYGIQIKLSFDYEFDLNETKIIRHIVVNIINNTIMFNNISNIVECAESDVFRMEISNGTNRTFINVTILTCDKISQNHVLAAFDDKEELKKDVIDKADQVGLIISLNQLRVNIYGDIILDITSIPNTTLGEESTVIELGADDENDISNILIGIGCGVFICIVILCLFCIYRIKKMHQENEHNQKQLQLDMTSTVHTMVNPNTNDNYLEVNVKSTKHDNNDNVEQLDEERFNISTPYGNNVDTIDAKIEIKRWLEVVVELPQYYDNLVDNGFESMAFIKEIGDKTELNDIGIVLIGHQIKIMAAIRGLNQEKNEHDVEEGTEGIEEGKKLNISRNVDVDYQTPMNTTTTIIFQNNDDIEVLGDDIVTNGETKH